MSLYPPHFWSPQQRGSPIFQAFRSPADDSVLRGLVQTQVALHQQRAAFAALLADAGHNEQEWGAQKAAMGDQLRQLNVRNAEAERWFKGQLSQVSQALQQTQDMLVSLSGEHDKLQTQSASTVADLQGRAKRLQASCADLETAKAQLQQQLKETSMQASLKDAAEARVVELEGAISQVQAASQRLIAELGEKRAAAEAAAQQLSSQLAQTQGALAAQAELQGYHENAALELAVERQRLLAALQVERLINEPLRSTHHATTTLTQVMRSVVAPTVSDRSRLPIDPRATSSPASYQAPTAMADVDVVAIPGSGRAGMTAATAAKAAAPSPTRSSSSRGGRAGPRASPISAPGTIRVSRPLMDQSLEGKALTRLGRSWATTTHTAGEPHPAFLDNQRSTPPGTPTAPAARHYSPFTTPTKTAPLRSKATPRGAVRPQPAHTSTPKSSPMSAGSRQAPSPADTVAYQGQH